jgi:uncharacterized membrane protein
VPYRAVVPQVSATERGDTRWTRRRKSLRTGLWFVPGLFVAAAALGSFVTVEIDRHLGGSPSWLFFNGGATSAEQILATIAASMMTVTGLVFTITVVVLQLASNQFSPRVLRTFLRDRGSQIPLGVFTATFVYSLFVLVRVRTGVVGSVFVPRLSITVAFALIALSMVAFVYFVNHVAQSIRVVNIIESVASETRAAIDAVFPMIPRDGAPAPELGPPVQTLVLERHGGVVAGLDIDALVDLARAHDCVLRMVPAMGDFVPEDAVVFTVHGGAGDVTLAEVLHHVDIARERSMRQDPGYGFRLLADIAEKALSPALNDPTTAVQAIDRIHDLLGRVARRPRPSGVYDDGSGAVRVIRKIISWDALVTLAFEEIREYGGDSVQVHRRLRASIEQLLEVVPVEHQEPLRRQLRLLRHSASRHFPDVEERALAILSDESGMGNADEETPTGEPG